MTTEVGTLLNEITHEKPNNNAVLSATCRLLANPIHFSEPLPLRVDLKVIGTQFTLKTNSTIELSCDPCYIKDLSIIQTDYSTNQEFSIEFKLNVRGKSNAVNLENVILIKATSPGNKPIEFDVAGFNLEMYFFVSELRDWTPPHANNSRILMVGLTGHGKSTLVNKIHSLGLSTYKERQTTAEVKGHVSKSLTEVGINFSDKVVFVDTPGISKYETAFMRNFENVLDGKIPFNKDLMINFADKLLDTPQNKISTCIFVVKYNIRMDPSQCDLINKFVRMALDREMSCVLAVTHKDDMEEEDLLCAPTDLSKITTINKRDIFLLDNSADKLNGNKLFKEEKEIFLLVKRALELAAISDERQDGFVPIEYNSYETAIKPVPKTQIVVTIIDIKAKKTLGTVFLYDNDPFLSKMRVCQLRYDIDEQLNIGEYSFNTPSNNSYIRRAQEKDAPVDILRTNDSNLTFNGAIIGVTLGPEANKLEKVYEQSKDYFINNNPLKTLLTGSGNTMANQNTYQQQQIKLEPTCNPKYVNYKKNGGREY